MKTPRRPTSQSRLVLTLLLYGCGSGTATHSKVVLDVPTSSIAGATSVRASLWTYGEAPPNAAIVFLHGIGGSDATWEQLNGNTVMRAVLDSAADHAVRPVVVAIRGDSLGWPNHRDGAVSWRAFLGEELSQFLRSRFGDAIATNRIAYVGTSAGGAAALGLALAEPSRFRCIAAHSPAIHPVDPGQMPDWAGSWDGWAAEYGSPIDTGLWRAANPIALASTQDSVALAGLRLYFDVGSEDHLGFAPTTSQLSDTLRSRGIAHEFFLRSGGHGSAFTGPNLVHSLSFLMTCLADQIALQPD